MGKMACDVDPSMEFRANTRADWYGAPAQMFCAPKSKVPKAPRWNYGPWCAPSGGWGHVEPFPDDVDLDTYFNYVNSGGICKDYAGQKAGGWEFCNGQGCPNPAAPLFGQPEGRTDLEGCCWWGRGVIQTTGVCNFGKLNYYLGSRAAAEGRDALFPQIDLRGGCSTRAEVDRWLLLLAERSEDLFKCTRRLWGCRPIQLHRRA